MNNNNNSKDVQDLFSSAVNDDGFDQGVALILVDNLNAVALAGCSGMDVDALNTEDVTLVALVLDESGSMQGCEKEIVKGYNTIIDAFRQSRQAESILFSTWSFSDQVKLHFSYTATPSVSPLTYADYAPNGGTALYDAVLHVMTGMVAYGQLLRNSGVRTRCIIVVFSDGQDNGSKATSPQVRKASAGLLAQEIYTLAYVGFGGTHLRQIADDIGFPEIITAQASPTEIRRTFHQVSTSIIQAGAGASKSFFVP